MGFRLDAMLVQKNLVKSRERAKEIIKQGGVKVNGNTVSKPAFVVCETDDVEVCVQQLKYVSRGGLKLEKAVELYKISLKDKVCVDLGASTGGFTDCMLKNGAKKVFAVDVGHNQLDKTLMENPKVVNLEGINVKEFSSEFTQGQVDFVTADLSFISVKKSLPVIKNLLKIKSCAVILIKPQFEVGKSKIGKGGIVKDKSAHIEMLTSLIPFIEECGFNIKGLTCSSIKGGDGNIEYLAFLENSSCDASYLCGFDVKKFVFECFELLK